MKVYVELMLSFMKVGALTFGGGYSMLPLLEKEIVTNKGWASNDELLEYFAVGQMTPGIIAINTATFIGYKQKGVVGGIFATLGMLIPSVLIILSIAMALEPFFETPLVQHAFHGIEIGVAVILTQAIWKLGTSSVKTRFAFWLFAAILLIQLFFALSPILWLFAILLIASLDYWRKNAWN